MLEQNPLDTKDNSSNLEQYTLIAKQENINLTAKHIVIINLLLNFYNEYLTVPSTRALINYAKNKQPNTLIDSLLFNKLFPEGIAQACRIAGLPKSPRCL